MSGSFQELINQSLNRSREATLSILGVKEAGLRAHLAEQMHDRMGEEGCFLAPPVFEHTFGWQPGDITLAALKGSLLSESVVGALTAEGEYGFDVDMYPYQHQLQSWQTLLADKPMSAVVTTGTGSGKTECFMVPILQDLVREYEQSGSPLEGVRALFLYPLNALINSQRDRLDAWTSPFQNGIRFCLYNGNTKESIAQRHQNQRPNEVLSREHLRRQPAPILMTNATMLEYMLVRQVDEPILRVSRDQQSLRWIVLDEAHTYIGSQAAELSLLLRRVVEAFGKQARDIRFVATSATIAGENAAQKLQTYLASLAGVPDDQVVVIGGSRKVPGVTPSEKNNYTLEDIYGIDPGKSVSSDRYMALANHPLAYRIRQIVVNNGKPLDLNELVEAVLLKLESGQVASRQQELLQWLDLMTGTLFSKNGLPFLKLRCHLHQRMLHGLWSCVDPGCSARSDHLRQWPFGKVYVTRRTRCECSAPVYEVAFCNGCKAPHLAAEDADGTLKQASPYAGDEFSLLDDQEEEAPEQEDTQYSHQQAVVLAPTTEDGYTDVPLDLESAKLGVLNGASVITINQATEAGSACAKCGEAGRHAAGFLRKCYLGAPFYVSNAVPTVLEFCPDPEGVTPESLPGRGRKLITFTDSRQGTARMAVRMQQEAERSRLRGLVFEVLRNRQAVENLNAPVLPDKSVDELLCEAKQLEGLGMGDLAQQRRNQARAMEQSAAGRPQIKLSWHELVDELAAANDIKHSILDYNRYANPEFFGGNDNSLTLAGLLLLREFARRPKHQNSSETLALVQVGYRGLDQIQNVPRNWAETQVPKVGEPWLTEALSLQDWKDFLKVTLDFHVRENTFFVINDNERQWLGAKFSTKKLVAPNIDHHDTSRVKSWPQFRPGGREPSRLIKLLLQGAALDPDSSIVRDKVNEWLKAAWKELTHLQVLQSQGGDGYTLNRHVITFSLPQKAWVCPISYRLLDTAFRGLTPYIPRKAERAQVECESVVIPDFTSLAPQGEAVGALTATREKVARNVNIQQLRQKNLWSDISDRTVEGGFYYRTAEHSAQQSAERLQKYENDFKNGNINVLNCSTTMEMGVDIGGISAVVMNNVPPHPANYLQRAGRAGRRSEARAVAYTLCKADPHNTRIFNNPKWAFETKIPAPVITLNAQPLVQRHVNSYLLSTFLKANSPAEDDRTRLTVKWFFNAGEGVVDRFVDWLGSNANTFEQGLNSIVRRTSLELSSTETLANNAVKAIRQVAKIWQEEYRQINYRLNRATDERYRRALEREKLRHEGEYLLKELATKAFLPGYGFPTNVVALNTYNVEDFKNKRQPHKGKIGREDNIFTYKEQPSRGLDIAVREYAPGAQVVIDGRVYRSAGIKMQAYQEGSAGSSQKFDIAWQCVSCGMPGYQAYAYSHANDLHCSQCEAVIPKTQVKKVLRPMGFVTDFYESTTNDVSTQKFIPVERPLVYVGGSIIALPDTACGYVRFGEDGQIVVRSGGENGNGFAVCMCCGRAESMTASNEVPEKMQPDQLHRPVGGAVGSKPIKDCSGEAVLRDIHLGYQARTHVVEWVLKNPLTGGWISENEDGRVIAMTLAVALRDAVADQLGIASSEMGFGVRPDRSLETGEKRYIVQVYDNASGGAGFVLTALDNMTDLLKAAFKKLECSADCETVCASCLASKDSRVEFEQLNRRMALNWLQEGNFSQHLALPNRFSAIEGARYWPYDPERFIRHWINRSAKEIFVRLAGNPEQWDLSSPVFRRQLIAWKTVDDCEVNVVLENKDLSVTIKEELALLARLGINVFHQNSSGDASGILYPAQLITKNDGFVTLLTDNYQSVIPGSDWLKAQDASVWVASESLPAWDLSPVDTSNWLGIYERATVIEVTKELNVPVKEISTYFKSLLTEEAPGFMARLQNEKVVSIRYEDRYLRSPWTVMLLAGFMQIIPSGAVNSVAVETVEASDNRQASRLWDNWANQHDMEKVLSQWLFAILDVMPEVNVSNSLADVSHRRVLTLGLESGDQLKLAFDQGMGYWHCHAMTYGVKRFDFTQSVEGQVRQMLESWKSVSLLNSGEWPTDIALYEVN